MKKLTIKLSLLLFIVTMFSATDSGLCKEISVEIKIDAARTLGPVPYIFRTGMFVPIGETGYPMQEFLKDHKVGVIQLCPITELQHCCSLREFKQKLPQSVASKWAIETKKAGGEVMILLGLCPTWLSSHSGSSFFGYPPKSYQSWQELVRTVVDYFNNQLHLDAKYVIWDEPNERSFWNAPENKYFELYKFSVLGAKKADRMAKVGGPAVSSFYGISRENGKPLIANFIEYCAKTSLPEIGLKKLPIDFIVWHDFNENPFSPLTYQVPVNKIRKWLKETGYSETTQLIVGSWNTWDAWGGGHPGTELSPERDTEYLAAFVITTLIAMNEAGVDHHTFFDLFGTWDKYKGYPEFAGTFGIFTQNYVIKPVYNAFRALNMIEGNRLQVSHQDRFLKVIATANKNCLALLISNFVPSEKLMTKSIRKELRAKGYTKRDFQLMFTRGDDIRGIVEKIISGDVSVDDIKISPTLKRDLKEIVVPCRECCTRRKVPVAVDLRLEHLPFDSEFKYERYIVDSSHSNSFAIRNEIEAAIKQCVRNGQDYLLNLGYPQDDVERLTLAFRMRRASKYIRQRLSLKEVRDIKKAKQIYKESLDKTICEINKWPEVQLTPAEEKKIHPEKIYKERIILEPNAIVLIVLSQE